MCSVYVGAHVGVCARGWVCVWGVHMGVHVGVYVCACGGAMGVHVGVNVGVHRGQGIISADTPQKLSALFYETRVSHWTGIHQHWLVSESQGSSCPCPTHSSGIISMQHHT